MTHTHLWLSLLKLAVTFEESECEDVVKICCIANVVYCLMKNKLLYHGTIPQAENNHVPLHLKKSDICCLDIACNSTTLYFVREDGRVFKTSQNSLNDYEEIVLKEDAKCCPHGYKTPGRIVKVKSVAVTDFSCLFLTESGQLWASGEHPQLNIQGEEPQKVLNFEKRLVKAAVCGSDFHLVLVKKSGHCMVENDNTDDDDDGEVFVVTCPRCVSEYVQSPMSQTSNSDFCPLGLLLHQSNTEQCSSSTTSKDNTADDKRSSDDSTSTSIIEESKQKEKQEELDNEPENLEAIDEPIEIENKEPSSLSPKPDKKTEFFINTDAARQFLSRQLSWVSNYGGSGEELLVECARPTRLLKQNVSTVANLVYEGVKTVGDRVATLSRHMSGGSETSENVPCGSGEFETFEDINSDFKAMVPGLSSNLRYEDFLTSSGATSEKGEESDNGLTDRIFSRVQAGSDHLTVEVWSWGNVSHGQLGTGDTIRKNKPAVVSRLSGLGVTKIVCGRFHALALTLDGRVFAWGKNNAHQVSVETSGDESSPRVVVIPNKERVKDIAAGDYHSLILTHNGDVFYIGKQDFGTEASKHIVRLNTLPADDGLCKVIFSSRQINGFRSTNHTISSVYQDLATEQSFLEEMLLVQNSIVKPLQKKGSEAATYEHICSSYNDVVSLTVLNVVTLLELMENKCDPSSVAIVQSVDEYIKVYRNYLTALCNVIALNGISQISHLIEPPQRVFHIFSDFLRMRNIQKNGENIVYHAFSNPIARLNIYKCMLQSWLSSGGLSETVEKRLREVYSRWDVLWDEQEVKRRDADTTRRFWENAGRLVELLRTPERRWIRDSRSNPIMIHNSGRFSTHWFILLTDVFVHTCGSLQFVHSLETVWVEPLQETEGVQNSMLLTMPEETLMLYTPTSQDKVEWIQALQNAIKKCLQKFQSHQPPIVRSASYTFTKSSVYRDAKYTGCWRNGKMHGFGKLEWPDGKSYVGQFQNNQLHGLGKMDTPSVSSYEGQWRDGLQNGYGRMKYVSGDLYEGHFKDGLAHGHGVYKRGHFMSSVASMYVGEWAGGVKQGYGVMDDIVTGEKYLGWWNNNMKQGRGLIVTLDGIYYEGDFTQDMLTGRGVVVFEDGTHYEGEFRGAGIFNGKGTLTFNSGDYFEGSLFGTWNEGVKVSGTWYKNTIQPPAQISSKPKLFGKLCVPADQKWESIFRQCRQVLGIEPAWKNGYKNSSDLQKLWENIAVLINNSRQETIRQKGNATKDSLWVDNLEKIPNFGRDKLNKEVYSEIKSYLSEAFDSLHHPLGSLLAEVTAAYTATYGGVRVHPLLLAHAVNELHSVTNRIYEIVQCLFPALPEPGQEIVLEFEDNEKEECDVVSAAAIVHPVLLPRVHSALFVLYALHNKQEDDAYWKRLLKWNKQPDTTLMAFLGIDKKFWISSSQYSSPKHYNESQSLLLQDEHFPEAVETLQQLKTTFSPLEKLLVIRNTFEQMTRVVQQQLGTTYLWSMDDLFPVFHFVVVRSRILQLGSEIHFIEDFMEPYLRNGELGIMFTTLKACYYQILQEKISMSF